ncbi:MAG: TetR/AcrR family transcriptional regulator [Syntrophaceae bacterium]|nr:TetR/AcrR family transcriptional regulator [Syntrophaceae bacterium]
MKAKQKLKSTTEEQDLTARERLMHAAAGLFSQKGYAATSVREIVTAAGVSKPVLYYYFKNKEGIYHEIIRFGLEKVDGLIKDIKAMDCPVSVKILSLFERTIDAIKEDMKIIRLLYAVQYGACREVPKVSLQDIQDLFDDAVLELVKEGIKKGELKPDDPELMRWVLVGAMSITVDMMIFRPELVGSRESLGRMVELILRGFVTKEN